MGRGRGGPAWPGSGSAAAGRGRPGPEGAGPRGRGAAAAARWGGPPGGLRGRVCGASPPPLPLSREPDLAAAIFPSPRSQRFLRSALFGAAGLGPFPHRVEAASCLPLLSARFHAVSRWVRRPWSSGFRVLRTSLEALCPRLDEMAPLRCEAATHRRAGCGGDDGAPPPPGFPAQAERMECDRGPSRWPKGACLGEYFLEIFF